MRVCFTIAELREGTGQTIMLAQVTNFLQSRVESLVLTPKASPESHKSFEKTEIIVSKSYFTSFLDQETVQTMKKSDVVFIKSGFPYVFPASESRKPLIYVLHQPDPWFIFQGRTRLNRLTISLFERPLLLRHVSSFVSVSEWVRKWYYDRYGINSKVIPDSIDGRSFRPLHNNINKEDTDSSLSLLNVGDWDGFRGRKRSHELIYMMPMVLRSYPTARLTIVGLSSSALSQLHNIANNMGITDSLRLIGKVSQEDLVKLYNSHQIFVTATLVEGFYRPLIEAFSCGLPAIVRDASGQFDTVCLAALNHLKVSEGGVSYDGSAHSFVSSIYRLLANYRAFRNNAIEYASRFDSSKILPSYLDVLNNANV